MGYISIHRAVANFTNLGVPIVILRLLVYPSVLFSKSSKLASSRVQIGRQLHSFIICNPQLILNSSTIKKSLTNSTCAITVMPWWVGWVGFSPVGIWGWITFWPEWHFSQRHFGQRHFGQDTFPLSISTWFLKYRLSLDFFFNFEISSLKIQKINLISKLIFAGYTGSKNQVRTRQKIKFVLK